MKQEIADNEKKINKNIFINNIRILEYETCFDEKITEEIEYIKQVLIKEKKLLNKNDYEITIFNKNKFPYIIGSGEEFNILFKIIKNAYINESIYSTNKINKNNIKNPKNKSLNILTQSESASNTEMNKILINSLNDFQSSVFFNSKSLEETPSTLPKKKNSVMISSNSDKSISQKIQEPLYSLGNLIKKKMTFIPTEENNSINNASNNNNKNKADINYTNNTNKTKTNYNNEKDTTNINDENDLDSYFDEHFRIYYITPVIFELNSDLFYENINMCIQVKWFNEINRYLMLSISIPDHIYINEYFEITIKIKNISYNPMNLIIQIKDNEKEAPINSLNKNKKIERVESVLTQTKIEHFGLIDCGDEKIHKLKFLPNINGYCYLPNLTLFDIYSDRKFYVVQNNKIFVEQNKL